MPSTYLGDCIPTCNFGVNIQITALSIWGTGVCEKEEKDPGLSEGDSVLPGPAEKRGSLWADLAWCGHLSVHPSLDVGIPGRSGGLSTEAPFDLQRGRAPSMGTRVC